MRFAVLLLLICACCQDAKPEDLYLVSTIKSYHLNREVRHNEKNFGLGLEYHVHRDLYLVGGYYDNSYDDHSNYAGIMYMPFMRGQFKAGMMAVSVTGYQPHPVFVAAPMFEWTYRHVGANLMVMLPPRPHAGVLGLQLKFLF